MGNHTFKQNQKMEIFSDSEIQVAVSFWLCPSIPPEAGLKAIKEALGNREWKTIPTKNSIKTVQFWSKIIILSQLKSQATCFMYSNRGQVHAYIKRASLWKGLRFNFKRFRYCICWFTIFTWYFLYLGSCRGKT